MSSFNEFLTMGGYAAYVWPAYAIAAVVVLVNLFAPGRRLKRIKDGIRRRKGAA
ncbi:MAG TPA: heme exporter protein CcmD [Gammaproteobacteria bacterium]|jgi:heme exporter protein D|nr:heme exporter protein CcmD [Gammaproteobacteria bacterium]